MIELKFGFLTFLLIGVPVVLSILIFWFIRKRNYSAKYRIVALAPLLFLAYGLYLGLEKPFELYHDHFRQITGMELPEETEFRDYTDWGYGTTPADNSSLFCVKVDSDFYTKLKNELNPSSEKLPTLNESLEKRFLSMFGEHYAEDVDFQFSDYTEEGSLLYFVGFFEDENLLLVYFWGD